MRIGMSRKDGIKLQDKKRGSKSSMCSEPAKKLEPTSGLEPLTCRLRIIVRSYRCSS
jgi:hypothetical protein